MKTKFFMMIACVVLIGASSCQKEETSSFQDLRMETVTDETTPISVVEFDTTGFNISTDLKGFAVLFQGKRIKTDFVVKDEHPDVEYIWLDSPQRWVLRVVSRPRICSNLYVLDTEGNVTVSEEVIVENNLRFYMTFKVQWDGASHLRIPSWNDKTILIN